MFQEKKTSQSSAKLYKGIKMNKRCQNPLTPVRKFPTNWFFCLDGRLLIELGVLMAERDYYLPLVTTFCIIQLRTCIQENFFFKKLVVLRLWIMEKLTVIYHEVYIPYQFVIVQFYFLTIRLYSVCNMIFCLNIFISWKELCARENFIPSRCLQTTVKSRAVVYKM